MRWVHSETFLTHICLVHTWAINIQIKFPHIFSFPFYGIFSYIRFSAFAFATLWVVLAEMQLYWEVLQDYLQKIVCLVLRAEGSLKIMWLAFLFNLGSNIRLRLWKTLGKVQYYLSAKKYMLKVNNRNIKIRW